MIRTYHLRWGDLMLAIVEAYRSGLLKSKYWPSNLIAGVIVGIVALPLAMAFAIASGAKPEQGLYTAIVAAIFVAIFGGTRVQIAGPTAAFIVILANITAHYGIGGLQFATFMAGFILLFMGFVKLGTVVKFIPDPVIVGFTSGIAVTIFVGQWQNFFGLSVHIPLNASFYQKLMTLIQALPDLNKMTTILGCLSILLVILTPFLMKRIPGPLVAMLVATFLLAGLHIKDVATLGSAFGGIPQQLPHFQMPSLSVKEILSLIAPAFTIALLGAIESLLSAAAADGMAGTRHNSNQELIGQGLANIFAPLFGGIAATGAIARTATNIRNGGTSPIAAITHSVVLIVFILLLAPFAKFVPLCALSAILFVVAYNIGDFKHFFYIVRHAPRYDVLVLLITFFLTVFTDLVVAVNIGVILSILFFLQRMYKSVVVEEHSLDRIKSEVQMDHALLERCTEDTVVYSIQGPFFFGVAEKVEHALDTSNTDPKTIIFRLRDVPFMDVTGLQTFHEIIERFNKRNIKVYLCEANTKVCYKLKQMELLPLIEKNKVFVSLKDVFEACSEKSNRPQNITFHTAMDRLDLVSPSVANFLRSWNSATSLSELLVAEIDPNYAGSTAFCEHYNVPLNEGVNCVIVEAIRGDKRTLAACVAPVDCRIDFNGIVRKILDARKVSFASIDEVLKKTNMEYGSVTPLGLPSNWPILLDERIINSSRIIIGSGLVNTKLCIPGQMLAELPNVIIVTLEKQ